MKRILQISVAGAVAIWSVASAVPAFAQRGCPEGRTASGQCVNAGLAAAIEQSGILFIAAEDFLHRVADPALGRHAVSISLQFDSLHDDAECGRSFAAATTTSKPKSKSGSITAPIRIGDCLAWTFDAPSAFAWEAAMTNRSMRLLLTTTAAVCVLLAWPHRSQAFEQEPRAVTDNTVDPGKLSEANKAAEVNQVVPQSNVPGFGSQGGDQHRPGTKIPGFDFSSSGNTPGTGTPLGGPKDVPRFENAGAVGLNLPGSGYQHGPDDINKVIGKLGQEAQGIVDKATQGGPNSLNIPTSSSAPGVREADGLLASLWSRLTGSDNGAKSAEKGQQAMQRAHQLPSQMPRWSTPGRRFRVILPGQRMERQSWSPSRIRQGLMSLRSRKRKTAQHGHMLALTTTEPERSR